MNVLRNCAILLLAILTLQSCANSRPVETLQWQGHQFREATHLGDLPTTVRSALDVTKPGTEGIADRGNGTTAPTQS
jgi:hypothetical protein